MWDARYSRDGYVYGTQPNDFLRENVTRLPKGRTLCIADGEGRNGCFLAGEGFDVLSVDQSAVGLAKARQLAEQLGVGIETRVCDMNDFDWSAASFASIVSIFAHMPLPVRRRVHRGVVEALQPGGVFLLEAYTPAQIGRGTGGPPTAQLTMSLADLRRELSGLRLEVAREIERVVVEGEFHTGDAAVVQIIAVRE